MISIPMLGLDDICRFWQYVDRSGDCWIWIGSQTGKRDIYRKPSFGVRSQNFVAYRISWMIHYKEDPGDLLVCHTCDNPLCVKPQHLWLGTHSDNQKDSHDKGRVYSSNRRKIQEWDLEKIRELREAGWTLQAIANRYNVTKTTIHLICSGQRYCNK